MSKTNNTKQAAWVAIGSLFSYGFALVSAMILSRYFDKGDYGTYKQVIYVYDTLLGLFTLGLPAAYTYFIPRVGESQEKNLIKKITNLFFLLGGIFSIFLYFGSSLFADFLNNKDLEEGLKTFSLVPFLMLPTMGLGAILSTYKKNMFMTAYIIITRIIMLICVTTPVIFFDGGFIEAIQGFVLSSFISFLIALYLKYYPVRNKKNEKCTTTYSEMFKFSLPLLYATLWGLVIGSADQFFISRYYGNEVFAEFSNGFIPLPFVGMIISSCATVLSPVFAKLSSQDEVDPQKEIYPIWMSVFRKTALLIYPLVIYCLFFAEEIMVVLYGNNYANSSVYFRIRLISNFFTLISYAPLIINIGKVKAYSDIHMYGALVLIVLEYLTVQFVGTAIGIAAVSVICLIGRIYFQLYIVARYLNKTVYQLFPMKLLLQILIPSLIILGAERILLGLLEVNDIIALILSVTVYFLLYFIYSIYAKFDYLSIVRPLFKH